MFQSMAIIGVGLIGGSLGADARKKRLARRVLGFGRSHQNLKEALRLKLIDGVENNLERLVASSDCILLCAPVKTILSLLPLIAKKAKPGTLVMDVGSTKQDIVLTAQKKFPKSIFFVGAHPMAGKEKGGAREAQVGFFSGKKCFLTPHANTHPRALKLAKAFWEKLGAHVLVVRPSQHDQIVATTSHLPQMAAYTLMKTAALSIPLSSLLTSSGTGFKDTTRLASSPADMWLDIVETNSRNIAKVLRVYSKELLRLAGWIEKKKSRALKSYFEKTSSLRKSLTS